jgi:hypothetical protein
MRVLFFTPAGVAVLGAMVLVPVSLRVGREVRAWRQEVERLTELRPALVELRATAAEAGRVAQALHHRSRSL